MKTSIITILSFIGLLILVSLANSCGSVFSHVSRMREVENIMPGNTQALTECLTVFREFFAYVRKKEPDIVTDEQAQNRWLTKHMRKSFAEYIKRSGKFEENDHYPSNKTFRSVWNKPTTYSVVGLRHYDFRNNDNPNDNRAIIDVLYEWGHEDTIDNQYPGEKQLHSFIFVFEDGTWKLDDVYTFDDEYSAPQSLRNYFDKK